MCEKILGAGAESDNPLDPSGACPPERAEVCFNAILCCEECGIFACHGGRTQDTIRTIEMRLVLII